MAREWIGDLVAQLHTQKIGRREFARRAAALGISAGLIGQVVRVAEARAQDASPAASPAGGGTIGRADVPTSPTPARGRSGSTPRGR